MRSVSLWSPTLGDVTLDQQLLEEILGGTGGGALSNTSITTAGAGVLTAAGLVGGQITRTGPTAAYTDTTDTAAAIVAAEQGTKFQAGVTLLFFIKNNTAFPQTLAGGTGVTMSSVTVIPPFSVGQYFGTIGGTSDVPTMTWTHMGTATRTTDALEAATGLATVGDGVITAAGIAGKVTTRTGATAAFTDTTATADLIIAAMPNALVGQTFEWTYVNNTVAPATIAGGVGVTASAVIPAHSFTRFLVNYSVASTIVMTKIAQGYFPTVGTFTANGATPVTVTDANVTAGSTITPTLKTVGGTVGALPAIKTITPGTGFTVAATASDTSVYNYEIRG